MTSGSGLVPAISSPGLPGVKYMMVKTTKVTPRIIGIISKSDLAPENETVCIRQLKMIGAAEPYFKVSVPNGTGIEELKRYLSELKER